MEDLDMLGAEGFGDNMLEAFAAAGTPTLADVRAGKATLRKGMKGPEVEHIQRKLSVNPVSGTYDDNTEAAVKRLQDAMNLGVDGVVDRATLVALDTLAPEVYRINEKAPKETPWPLYVALGLLAVGGLYVAAR